MKPRLDHNAYTVGWVCALPIEGAAAQEMLDEEHADLPTRGDDTNIYSLGRIGDHNVVVACLPAGRTGRAPALAVAMRMKATFPAIRFGLMVGIGGGVPSAEADIRLGDVVVSQPGKGHGGVILYDFGKTKPSGFERTGFLNSPPQFLLGVVTKLQGQHIRGRGNFKSYFKKLESSAAFSRPQKCDDFLFNAKYDHVGGPTACKECDKNKKEKRRFREAEVKIHYGTIASGDQVMRYGRERDRVSEEFGGVLCFEMEAAGLMDNFPCLVIRGVCDYADSHKNKKWQPYAAATAAAYAKELLSLVPVAEVVKMQTVDEATAQRSPCFLLPARNRRFTGRTGELERLTSELLVKRTCNTMALVGLGGAGKTQIALKLAYDLKDSQPSYSVFWLPALSMEAFEQGCGEIARKLDLRLTDKEDVKILVQQELSDETRGKWLLIVDNADNYDLICGKSGSPGIRNFLPISDYGLTVYTTRNCDVAQAVAGDAIVDVERMDEQDALDLLQTIIARKGSLGSELEMKELLEELEYLPLAISQAAAYINTKKLSLRSYLERMKKTEESLVSMMSMELCDSTRGYGAANAVATTWIVSFEELDEAARILEFMSCIEWKAIPHSILPKESTDEQLEVDIDTLCSYSFVTRRESEQTYDMHRLVHLATRIWLEHHKRQIAEVRRAATKHLVTAFPSHDYSHCEIWRAYLPHVTRANEKAEDGEDRSQLCLAVGRCLEMDGRIRGAVAWLEKSQRWANTLDNEDQYRLEVQYSLGAMYRADGQARKAVELLEMVAAAWERLAEDHWLRLGSQHEFAVAYLANGQVTQAIELLERVVAIRGEVLAEDHLDLLASQHMLATAYVRDSQVPRAIELLERVVAIRGESEVEDHPDRLASQHALARAYLENGQIPQAIQLLERVVAIEAKVLVEDHPERLVSQHELARVYYAGGQVQQAVELLERVVAIKAKVLTIAPPDRLASQHNLAFYYAQSGRRDEAVTLLTHVVRGQSTLAADHPNRVGSEKLLALLTGGDSSNESDATGD